MSAGCFVTPRELAGRTPFPECDRRSPPWSRCPPSAAFRQPPSVSRLPSAAFRQPPSVCCPPSAALRQLLSVSCSPSAALRQLLSVCCPLSAALRQLLSVCCPLSAAPSVCQPKYVVLRKCVADKSMIFSVLCNCSARYCVRTFQEMFIFKQIAATIFPAVYPAAESFTFSKTIPFMAAPDRPSFFSTVIRGVTRSTPDDEIDRFCC